MINTEPKREAPILDAVAYCRGAFTTADVVRNWHNETHPGAFRHCHEQPCYAVTWRTRTSPPA